jgi:GDPmannose 4,6-dehydratase
MAALAPQLESELKALICGITGQDGAYLAQLLLSKGYAVTGTSRDAQVSRFSNLERLGIRNQLAYLSMAPNDFRSVLQTISKTMPDEIYYLAGQSSVGLSFEQPMETLESIATGVMNVLEAIRFLKIPSKLYNAGSSECFGDTGGVYATEDVAFRPRSPYAVAKAAAHFQIANYREAYGIYACTGILFNHESPFRPTRFVTRKIVSTACRIHRGSTERLTLGNVRLKRDWGWAPDYVEAMWRMLQGNAMADAADFVIATGEANAIADFAACAFEMLSLDWESYTDINQEFFRPTDIAFSGGNPSKARALLGWTPKYKMREVVRAMIDAELDTATEHH